MYATEKFPVREGCEPRSWTLTDECLVFSYSYINTEFFVGILTINGFSFTFAIFFTFINNVNLLHI